MAMKKINANLISKAQRRIGQFVKRRNRALGLTYLEVQGENLVRIYPDGRMEVMGKPKFGLTKVAVRRILLKREA
jgi:hypothetical protein